MPYFLEMKGLRRTGDAQRTKVGIKKKCFGKVTFIFKINAHGKIR